MEAIDFKNELKHLYLASAKEVELVDVPALNFLMVVGQGDPNTAQSCPRRTSGRPSSAGPCNDVGLRQPQQPNFQARRT